jgi:hypothetical protein
LLPGYTALHPRRLILLIAPAVKTSNPIRLEDFTSKESDNFFSGESVKLTAVKKSGAVPPLPRMSP